jgi:hypothetical protein
MARRRFLMKNLWIRKWKLKHETDILLDFNALLGDTIKEKFEQIYSVIAGVYQSRNGFKIETSPEAGSMFDVSCRGFDPPTQEDLDNMAKDRSYRVRGGSANGMNLWIIPAMTDPIFHVHTANLKNGPVIEIVKIGLDNFIFW